ncbi:protein kinase [Nonomuraea sp. NPDC050556]|uniref:protein kinase domain-containing protein n=1 Tax=Nonomuraea sp. NPDC050556 TaxID=3364369 RepID=UPI00379292C4
MLIEGDPQRLGGYWLAGRLGAGGQGVVYEAYAEDGRRVAIKVLHGDQVAQLGREATAAQRVASFCTAPVIAAELGGPRPYIVSEYVEGPSLRKCVEDGRRFRGDDLHRLATAIATALTAIHDAGVIHRDLKPDNVLLGPDGPRVIDFGIARTAEMSLTATGVVTGTPTYMAPEVFTGQRAGPPADVFAWACVMIFAASGADPFQAESLGGVMHRVLSSSPNLDLLPGTLRPMVAAALAKEPALRPTARQLLLALVSGDGGLDTPRLLAAGGLRAAGIGAQADDPALGTLAEDAYTSLDPAERELAPEVFLRLVTVDEAGELSVRPAELSELVEGRSLPEVAAITRILDVFGYLLSRTDDEVRLARPALPQAWPRFRRWIDSNRDGLAVHREILTGARRWASAGRRDGDLFQGSSLENALQWAATARRHITLSPAERDFLSAAAVLTRRRARRTRLASLGLAGLLVIALVAGGLAVQQGLLADSRAEQIAGQLATSEASRLATLAEATRRTDPKLAMLYSAAAWRLARTPQTRAALNGSLAMRETAAFADPAAGAVRALSSDGHTLASASDGAVRLWDVRSGARTATIEGVEGALAHVALSDTTLLVVTDAAARAWRLPGGEPLGTWRFAEKLDLLNGWAEASFYSTAPVITITGDAYRWDPATGARKRLDAKTSLDGQWKTAERGASILTLTNLRTGASDEIGDKDGAGTQGTWNRGVVTVSADGTLLASADDRTIQFWRMADTQLLTSVPVRGEGEESTTPRGAFDGKVFRYLVADRVFSVNVSDLAVKPADTLVGEATLAPGGQRVVTDQVLRDAATGKVLGKVPAADSVAFSADGKVMAFVTQDRVTVMEGGRATVLDARYGSAGPLQATFSPSGDRLAIGLGSPDDGGTHLKFATQVWDWRARRKLWSAELGRVTGVTFSPDGKLLASAGDQERIVDAATGKVRGEPFGSRGLRAFFTRAGALVVLDTQGRLTRWDLASRRPMGPVARARPADVAVAAYSPAEDLVAVAEPGGRVRLLDPISGAGLGTLADSGGGQDPEIWQIRSLAFTADGSAVVTVDGNGTVRSHPVAGDGVAARVCARAGRTLTAQEWARLVPGVPYRAVCP